MIDGKFDVVFRGQIIRNVDASEVKANLVTMFKSTPDAIEKLFSGNEVAVRKNLDYSTAMKYQSALRKAGALALIKEVESKEPSEPTIKASSSGRASFGTVDSSKPEANSDTTPIKKVDTSYDKENVSSSFNSGVGSSIQSKAPDGEANSSKIDEGAMSLAKVGAQIMPDKVYEKRNVDTSDMSLAAAGERIMPKKAPEVVAQPSIDHLKLED